jgi:hypothetical protein
MTLNAQFKLHVEIGSVSETHIHNVETESISEIGIGIGIGPGWEFNSEFNILNLKKFKVK